MTTPSALIMSPVPFLKTSQSTANELIGELPIPKDEIVKLLKELEKQMKQAAKDLEFEKAAALRDQVIELRRTMALEGETV